MAEKNSSMNGDQLITTMDNFYKKAPQLPANIREVLVKIAPWFAIIFGILGILGGLSIIGVSPVAMEMGAVESPAYGMIIGILSIASGVLLVMAFPKLKKHQYAGWKLLFWSSVIGFVASLVYLSVAAIISAIIWGLIRFYILFQIKSSYK